jgi:CYTH domain-containing protein
LSVVRRARIDNERLLHLLEPFIDDVAAVEPAIEALERLHHDLSDLHDVDVLIGAVAEQLARLDCAPDEVSDLAALRVHLHGERAAALERVAVEPLQTHLAEITAHVERVANELDTAGGASGWEIERKFLLNGVPRRRKGRSVVRIEQGWLPGDQIRERVRRIRSREGTRYERAIKLGKGLMRREIEEEIDAATFAKLWPLTRGCRIAKRRHAFRDGAHVWTVDRFTHLDLVLAEVELSSLDEEAEVPAWLQPHVVREVTGLADYQNINLARKAAAPPHGQVLTPSGHPIRPTSS